MILVSSKKCVSASTFQKTQAICGFVSPDSFNSVEVVEAMGSLTGAICVKVADLSASVCAAYIEKVIM